MLTTALAVWGTLYQPTYVLILLNFLIEFSRKLWKRNSESLTPSPGLNHIKASLAALTPAYKGLDLIQALGQLDLRNAHALASAS